MKTMRMEIFRWMLVLGLSFASSECVSIPEPNINSTGSTVATSLLREILLKQDMTQAMLLMNNIVQVMTDVQSLKDDVRQLHTENVDLRSQLSSARSQSCSETMRCLESTSPVAFYVYYSKDFKSLTEGSSLIYDTIETNLGNGYNKTSGIFTAPTTGLYAFSWTLHVAGKDVVGTSSSNSNRHKRYGEMNAVLTQNGSRKGAIVADTEVEYDEDSSTGFVLLESKSGDEFQIVVDWDGQGDVYSNDRQGRTSFSGFSIL